MARLLPEKGSRRAIALIAALLPVLAGSSDVSAVSHYWGGSAADPTGTNVSGYWSDNASNPSIWSSGGSAPVPWNNNGSIDAVIGNPAAAGATWSVSLGDSSAKAYSASASSVAISLPAGDTFSLAGQGGKGATLTTTGGLSITSAGGSPTRVTLKDFKLTGAGSLTIGAGAGNVVGISNGSATSNFDFTGITTLNSGTYQASQIANGGAAGLFGKSSSSAANLVFNGGTYSFSGTTTNSASTDRLFTLGTGGGTLTNSVTTGRLNFTNTGEIAFQGTGPRTLTLGGVSTASAGGLTGNVLSAILHDENAVTGKTSIAKTGNGIWTLAGASDYTGNTTVSAGKLLVNGSIVSPVILCGSGLIGGSGTTGPITAGSGATISPGNSIGTLSTGSVAFSENSVFAVEVGTAGSADLLSIEGSLNLTASLDTLALTHTNGFDGSDYTIATFTTGALGVNTFGLVTLNGAAVNPAGFAAGEFTYAVAYTDSLGGGGSVQLVSVPEPASFAILFLSASLLLGRKRAIHN